MTLALSLQMRRYTAVTCSDVFQRMFRGTLASNGRRYCAPKASNSGVSAGYPDIQRYRPKTISHGRYAGGSHPRGGTRASGQWSGLVPVARSLRLISKASPPVGTIAEYFGQGRITDRRLTLAAELEAAVGPNPLASAPGVSLAEAGRVSGDECAASVGLSEVPGHLGYPSEFRCDFQRRYNSRFDMADHTVDACNRPHSASDHLAGLRLPAGRPRRCTSFLSNLLAITPAPYMPGPHGEHHVL